MEAAPEGQEQVDGLDEQVAGVREPTPPAYESPRVLSFAPDTAGGEGEGDAYGEPDVEPEVVAPDSERAGELDAGGGAPDEDVEVVQPGGADDDVANADADGEPEIVEAADD